MDNEGWSRVVHGTVLVGMGSSGQTNLHQVGPAYYHKVFGVLDGQLPTVTEVNWGDSLANGEPALCPDGSWISGLYRTGSRHDPSVRGGHQITRGECSQFAGADHWGDCVEIDMFQTPGPE